MFKVILKYAVVLTVTYCYSANSMANGACFINENKKNNPIRVKLLYPDLTGSVSVPARIKYEKGRSEINIKRVNDELISVGSRINTGRTTYAEIINGKKTGYYYLTTEGPQPLELKYKNITKKSVIKFRYDHGVGIYDRCKWEEADRSN